MPVWPFKRRAPRDQHAVPAPEPTPVVDEKTLEMLRAQGWLFWMPHTLLTR